MTEEVSPLELTKRTTKGREHVRFVVQATLSGIVMYLRVDELFRNQRIPMAKLVD